MPKKVIKTGKDEDRLNHLEGINEVRGQLKKISDDLQPGNGHSLSSDLPGPPKLSLTRRLAEFLRRYIDKE